MFLGYIYTSIYYCCKSFPVLLHDVMGGWIASWVSMLYYVLPYYCSAAVLLLYRVMGGFFPVVCCCRVYTRVRGCDVGYIK